MPITIKEIATLAGVSVGTVDRVIHNRGRVRKEVAERVSAIVNEYGYEPSRAGRALVLSKKPVSIGIVLHEGNTAFMRQSLEGIEKTKADLESLGANIMLKIVNMMDAELQVKALDELVEEGAKAIAVSPAENVTLAGKIDELVDLGIPIVTFNTDLSNTKRMCFVGLDNFRSGRVAAELMGKLLGRGGKAVVISGHTANQSHSLRVEGFLKEIAEFHKNVLITGVYLCNEHDDTAERQIISCIKSIPDLEGVLIVSGGENGVYKALLKSGKVGKIKVIAYDMTEETKAALTNGIVDFVIDQDAYSQGYKPAQILFEHLFSVKDPPCELQYTDIIIKTKHN